MVKMGKTLMKKAPEMGLCLYLALAFSSHGVFPIVFPIVFPDAFDGLFGGRT